MSTSKNPPSNTTVTTNSNSTVDLNVVVDIATQIANELATTVVKETIKKAVKEIQIQEKFPKPSIRLQRIAEPSMTSYLNLYNNHRSVLKPDKILRLEEKLSDIRKYSQVISDELKILIVDKINGITQSQGTQLQMKVMESLEAYVATNPDKEIPKFLETSYSFKCVKMVCADQFTVKWLTDIITGLSPPPWQGARLEVTQMSMYSIYSAPAPSKRAIKMRPREVRVKFGIPNVVAVVDPSAMTYTSTSSTTTTGQAAATSQAPTTGQVPATAQGATTGQVPPAGQAQTATATTQPSATGQRTLTAAAPIKVPFDEVKKRIAMCNPPIKTDSWKELMTEEKNKLTMYYVVINSDCLEEIRNNGNRLFYLLGTIKILPLNETDQIACNAVLNKKNKLTSPYTLPCRLYVTSPMTQI